MKTYRDEIDRLKLRVKALEASIAELRQPSPISFADQEDAAGRFANPRTGIRPLRPFPPTCKTCGGLRKIGVAYPDKELAEWMPCPSCR